MAAIFSVEVTMPSVRSGQDEGGGVFFESKDSRSRGFEGSSGESVRIEKNPIR